MRIAALICVCSFASAAVAAPPAHWILQGQTVKPATAPAGWVYTAESTTVRRTIGEGREVELGWTRLPTEIEGEGFFITLLARATSTAGTDTVGEVALTPAGFAYDKTPGALRVEASSVNGQPAEVSKTVKLTPLPKGARLTVNIDSGSVRHTYTYLRK